MLLKALTENAITYAVFNGECGEAGYYDAILDIAGDGTWEWKPLRGPRAPEHTTLTRGP